MATTTSTSTGEATFVEDVKKRPDRTDSVLSGARTPSTVGDLTPGFRGRLDSSDPFWGLEFTEEMALAAMKKEMKKRVWPDSRVHTDGSAKQRTWRLDPTDFDMGHMFAAGEDTDGYVMKFGDFDMEYFFEDPNPPPEAMPLSWNMWEIELFGPIREDVKGMFKPEPVHDVERFVDHGHDYDTIDESELSDFWECWEISPVVHVGVVEAVLELLKDPVYVLTIDQSVLKGAEWLSLIRIHPVVEYPIILSQTSSCLHPQNLLETARAQQPALGCQGILPLLAGGIMQARLKALLSRLTRHEIVEADPRVQEESIRKWLWKACLDKSLTEAWPPTKWLGPLEMLYVEAQAVFVRDLGAIAGLLKAQHISGRTTADVNACPGLAVARAAVASRVLLVEGSEMLNMLDDDVSSMAQEVATLIVLSAMDTKWPYQQQPETVDDAAEVFFSHRFEREPWVPLSRLSAAFCHSGNSPLVPRQWRLKEPSQYALLAERLSKAIEAGKVYVGPRYLPPSYTLQDRVRSSLDYLSWCLAHQPQRSVPPREALSPLASWWDYIGLRLADLVWGIRDLMRLHQPGVLVHAYWLHKWSSAPKPLPKPSVYGGDAFAWKRPGRAGCETLALRMPAPPYRTVIDAVGSAAAVPVDHLASYLELRSNDIAQSWRSYRALNRYAELTAVFAKWLVVLGLLHSTVPSINMLPSTLGPDSSVFTYALLAIGCCPGGGLWVGILGTWIKIPMSLIGEWPVDNYVLGLLILPLISRSKLQWPALAYPTVEEWALGSIALSSLLPAVGIQAVWLYVLGAILGNVICREMEAQAGIAAVISYLVGESMVFANHRNDFDGLTLLWFHDLGPSTFAVVYAVLASTTYVAFAPRCRRELMCLKRADWWVSCAAVDGPFMSDAPSSPRPVVLGTCPGEAARSYLAWLGPRATAAAYILQNELQAQDLPRPPEHTCVRTDPHKQTVGSTQELLTFDMDTLPRVGPEIITLPPSVPIAEHHHEPDSWSSWGSRASVSHPAVCEAHLPSPSLDPLVAPTILFLVYAAVLSRMSQEESPSAVAAACLAEVYTHITRNGAPCCRLAKTVLGAWKGGWGYCCFCEMKNLIVSAALSFPTESARLEVGSITPEAEDEASLVDAPSSRASVIAGNVPIEAAEPAPAAPPLSETKATTTELPSTAFRQDCVFCPLGESILAEHVALCTLARLQGTLPKNSLSKLEPVGDVDKGSNAPPNSSRLDITANRPRFQSSPELITAFDALLVQEAFLASLERRNRSSHQQWRRRSSRMKARPRSDMMPTRPLSSPGVAPRAYVRPFTPHDQLPYSLYVEKVENDFIATFCKSPRILPPHTVSRLESSSHMLARYILRDLYFTIGIIYALEGGRWPHPPSAEVGRKPSPGSLSAVTFRLTRISEPRPRSLGCQTDLAGLTGSMIDITLAAQSTTTAGRSEDVTVKSNEAHLVIADSMTISLQCMVHSKDAEEKTVQASRKAGHCNSNQKAEMPVVEMVSSAVQTMSPRQRLEAGTFCDLSNISVVPPDATSNTVVSRTPAGGNNHFKSNTVMEDDAMDLTAARRCSVEFVGYLMARCACRMMARSSLDSLFARIVAPARGTLPRAERVTGGSSVGIQCVDETHSDSTEFVPAYLTSPCNVACQTNSPRPSHLRLLLLMAAQRRLLSSGAVDRLRPAPEEAPASCGRRGGRNRQPPSSTPSVSNTAPPPGLAPATPCLLFETSSSVVSQELTSTYKSVATTLRRSEPSMRQASPRRGSAIVGCSPRRSLLPAKAARRSPLYRRAYSSVKPLRAKPSDEHRYELRFSPTMS